MGNTKAQELSEQLLESNKREIIYLKQMVEKKENKIQKLTRRDSDRIIDQLKKRVQQLKKNNQE